MAVKIQQMFTIYTTYISASDWTMYPFSTQNQKDYENLLSVYMDAVFFPQLRELDFRFVCSVLYACQNEGFDYLTDSQVSNFANPDIFSLSILQIPPPSHIVPHPANHMLQGLSSLFYCIQ